LQNIEMNNELHLCAASGNLERVKQLVEGGANIEELDEDGTTALSLATVNNHFDIVVYLASYLMRLHYIERSNELHLCAASGNLERVKQLVEGGANIEELDEDGTTALSLATVNNHFEIVVYLLEHGANVAHGDDERKTALHWACIAGTLSSVKYLGEHGARITERDDIGLTPFLYAAENRYLRVVKHLLSSEVGASITDTDDAGNTALLLAAGEIYPDMVQWLLEHGGAQITDTNNAGYSVWTVRRETSLQDVLQSAYMKDDVGEYVFSTAITSQMETQWH
jgi:ankyrin repeat protein